MIKDKTQQTILAEEYAHFKRMILSFCRLRMIAGIVAIFTASTIAWPRSILAEKPKLAEAGADNPYQPIKSEQKFQAFAFPGSKAVVRLSEFGGNLILSSLVEGDGTVLVLEKTVTLENSTGGQHSSLVVQLPSVLDIGYVQDLTVVDTGLLRQHDTYAMLPGDFIFSESSIPFVWRSVNIADVGSGVADNQLTVVSVTKEQLRIQLNLKFVLREKSVKSSDRVKRLMRDVRADFFERERDKHLVEHPLGAILEELRRKSKVPRK